MAAAKYSWNVASIQMFKSRSDFHNSLFVSERWRSGHPLTVTHETWRIDWVLNNDEVSCDWSRRVASRDRASTRNSGNIESGDLVESMQSANGGVSCWWVISHKLGPKMLMLVTDMIYIYRVTCLSWSGLMFGSSAPIWGLECPYCYTPGRMDMKCRKSGDQCWMMHVNTRQNSTRSSDLDHSNDSKHTFYYCASLSPQTLHVLKARRAWYMYHGCSQETSMTFVLLLDLLIDVMYLHHIQHLQYGYYRYV